MMNGVRDYDKTA